MVERTYHRWTEDEREIVRRDYRSDRLTTHAIAQKLGVSFFAVKDQAGNLGVMRSKPPVWTPEEEARLQELLPQKSPRAISKIIGRTETAVIVKAKRLHLSRRHREGWYTQREACDILGVDHHMFEKWVDRGLIIRTRRNDVEGGIWEITEKELRRFIIKYAAELVGRRVDIIQVVDILANGKSD